jgi:hypothetical protein
MDLKLSLKGVAMTKNGLRGTLEKEGFLNALCVVIRD